MILEKERVSTRCVCCGSDSIKSSPAILMPFIAHRVFGWKPVAIDESWGLSTIKNGNAYSVCNSLYCLNCEFLFLDIRFSDGELGRLYDDYRGEAYTRLREFYEPGYSARNDSLNTGGDYVGIVENFLQNHLELPVSVLDWGGDTGKNTPFKENSTALDIYDISNKSVVEGANFVNKIEAVSKKYGLIVCANVLEHVSYPSELLAEVLKSMDANSLLYIEVPLEGLVFTNTVDPHLLKKHWHEHINFFSEKSLRHLVEGVGLKVLNIERTQVVCAGKSAHIFQVACRLAPK